MSKNKKPHVLFVMTGSIACYKACQIISRMVQKNISVQVVATPAALKFVGEATLEGLSSLPVISDLYARGTMMDHIHLVRKADLILTAPATANHINKISQGLGDDLASTLFLAHDFKKPFLIAPAMNTQMYFHPITQEAIKKLSSFPGVSILDSASGVLACGEEGYGKLLDPDLILQEVLKKLSNATTVKDKNHTSENSHFGKKKKALRILVTAGGTQEKIDQVRAITNLSTGRTGLEITRDLNQLGVETTLLLSAHSPFLKDAQINEQANTSFVLKTFTDYESLKRVLLGELETQDFDFVIHSAAVSDYSVAKVESLGNDLTSAKKISDSEEIVLRLKKNPKLIDFLKKNSKNKNVQVIGFKLTAHSSDEEIYAKVAKLFTNANCDFVVHNDISQIDKAKNQHPFSFCSQKPSQEIEFKECENLHQLSSQIFQTIMSEVSV